MATKFRTWSNECPRKEWPFMQKGNIYFLGEIYRAINQQINDSVRQGCYLALGGESFQILSSLDYTVGKRSLI